MYNYQLSMNNEECLSSPLYSLPACVRERGETALAERGSEMDSRLSGNDNFSLLSSHYLNRSKVAILNSLTT
jgi:hypothetical protein